MKILFDIILISLFCNGIYLLFNFGNLFEFVRLWYVETSAGIQRTDGGIAWTMDANGNVIHPIKIFFYKPLFGCITCMASFWGSVAYWSLQLINHSITIHILLMWPIIIVSCACMNVVINRIYE